MGCLKLRDAAVHFALHSEAHKNAMDKLGVADRSNRTLFLFASYSVYKHGTSFYSAFVTMGKRHTLPRERLAFSFGFCLRFGCGNKTYPADRSIPITVVERMENITGLFH